MQRMIQSARRRALACLAVGSLLLLPAVTQAKNCEMGSPAFGVNAALWGNLKPADIGQLPDPRDSSNYNGTQRPDDVVYKVPLFTSMDVENGWIFQTYTQGIKVWNATGGNAANPVLTATRDCQAQGFLACLPGQHELRELFWDVDAPEGVDTVVATVSAPLGIQIWDMTSKGSPKQVYQDTNRGMYQVWSATIGGRHYAFAADEGFDPGVQLYDMTAALQLGSNPCLETPPERSCGSVWKRRIGTAQAVGYIDGFKRSDGKTFIVFASGGNGYEIWDVSNPLSPVSVTNGRLLANELIYGVAIWEQGGKQFVAMQSIIRGGGGQGGRIYDVTNCLNGNCGGLTPVWSKAWSVAATRHFVTYSKSGGKHFLYFGNEEKCSGGRQREWLLDVSNVAAQGSSGVQDLTPPGTLVVSGPNEHGVIETATVDYWSFYYAANPSGFSEVMPRMGKVYGNHFYRQAWTIFDVHELTGGLAPSANFTWSPAEVYVGTPVTFTDTSVGVLTSRTWTFPDGTPSSSTTTPQVVTFSSPGQKAVSLNVGNLVGPSSITQNVNVLDPAPVVSGGTASPNPAVVCQPVTFTATGVGGRAPLAVNWQIEDTGINLSGNPAVWNTAAIPPGTYRAIPTVSNGTGSVTLPAGSSPTVTLQALAPLPSNNSFAPTTDPFSAGTVQFHLASLPGATEWKWDFGDGTTPVWTNNPATGPNPVHSYTSIGAKNVKVTVRNCDVQQGERESSVLGINITQINPLKINEFSPACNFNPCSGTVGVALSFIQEVEGSPDTYEYDWNGDGSFEQTSSTPVLTHTYPAVGNFAATLRVKRGAETVTRSAQVVSISNAGPGPGPGPGPTVSITISGPASGQTGQALAFSASGNNCTPTATWNWTASGGTITGGTASAVTISWSTTGSKSVSVTNSGCSGTPGSKSVTIGGDPGPGPGPGGLTANFSFSPAAPSAGQTVSFDAGSSTGAPTAYTWTFGDGSAVVSTATATVTHTFPGTGPYTVKLEIGKSNPSCSFGFCTASITKVVTVGGGGPVLSASFTTNADCIEEFGVASCAAERNQAVTFTATSTGGATTHAWSFGDGGTASGAQVTHTWSNAGTFAVVLISGNGTTTSQSSKSFVIAGGGGGEPTPVVNSLVLPWIAQTRGALVQSSDLYILNPGTIEMKVRLQFRKRGTPESSYPEAPRTIPAGATLFVGDALRDLFLRQNVAGFITVIVDSGNADPLITSFNTTFQTDGRQFGQTVPSFTLSSLGSSSGSGTEPRVQHLVGLNDNNERLAYFGVSNPNDEPATYRLRFYNALGQPIGNPTAPLTIPRFGQRQYQVKEIRETLGISHQDDYRVEVETLEGGTVVPYGSNLRLASDDPSFVVGSSSKTSKVYLIGALSSPGLNNSTWQTDVVLANTSNQVVLTDVTFTNVGTSSVPTSKVTVTLQPRETERLANVIASKWGITNGIGVVTLESDSPNDVFPAIQGESYDNSVPSKRFGQTMIALTDADAAGVGKSQYMAGLRQDAKYRTTFWLFNPGTGPAEYDIIYLDLNGSEIDRLAGVRLGAGKMRQLSPGQHPLPASGVVNGFTVQILVKSGKVLSGAQVVNNLTNDPAYIQGEVR